MNSDQPAADVEPAAGVSLWRAPQFRSYLTGTASVGLALAMQQLLLSWILVGILQLPAAQVGTLQALIGVPAIFFTLWGGARSDSSDARMLLLRIYWIAPVFPLFLLVVEQLHGLSTPAVLTWGMGVAIIQALSMPAQQAIVNKISGQHVQQGVTAATAVQYVVQVVGLLIAGQMDRLGLQVVLLAQILGFCGAALAIMRIESQALVAGTSTSPMRQIAEGLRATWAHPLILSVLIINFVSSAFNAGSFMTVLPFVVKLVYQGDALALGLLMAIFFTGAAGSNALLLRFMPIARPGRLYLLMQLSRIIALACIYFAAGWPMLILGVVLWGLNMGVTSNLARMLVQETAPEAYRGRILAVFTVSMVGSAPLGAVVLGFIIQGFDPLTALWPAMLVSAGLTLYGVMFTPVWGYRSEFAPSATGAPDSETDEKGASR